MLDSGTAYSEVDNIKIDGESFKFDKNNSILMLIKQKLFYLKKI